MSAGYKNAAELAKLSPKLGQRNSVGLGRWMDGFLGFLGFLDRNSGKMAWHLVSLLHLVKFRCLHGLLLATNEMRCSEVGCWKILGLGSGGVLQRLRASKFDFRTYPQPHPPTAGNFPYLLRAQSNMQNMHFRLFFPLPFFLY